MRIFFQKDFKKILQIYENFATFPKVQLHTIGPYGRSAYSIYVLVYHNLQSNFFSAYRMKPQVSLFLTFLFNRSIGGYFVTIILNSMNYFIDSRFERKLKLDLHFSRNLIFPLPESIFVRIFKRRISFFGLPERVIPITYALVNLRPFDMYTGYGIRIPTSGAKKKPGKVRLR